MRATSPPSIIEHKTSTHTKKYKRLKHLGTGGFANVYQVESLDSFRIYACKVINKKLLTRKEHQRKLISEVKLHQALSHKNIVKFERFFEDKVNVYMLLECCPNHSLMELMHRRQKLTEYEVRYFMNQILNGIKFLHSNFIIHRDLKLGNLLLDKDLNIKICDFGLATKLEFDGARKTTICGTPNYIAPEILNGKKSGEGHSYEVDIWSIGVIMFTLLCGKPPFETKNIEETYKRIKKLHYKFPKHLNLTDSSKNLIKKILTIKPNERPNLHQIECHPFFRNNLIPKKLPLFILKKEPKKMELFPELKHQQQQQQKSSFNQHQHQRQQQHQQFPLHHGLYSNRNPHHSNNHHHHYYNNHAHQNMMRMRSRPQDDSINDEDDDIEHDDDDDINDQMSNWKLSSSSNKKNKYTDNNKKQQHQQQQQQHLYHHPPNGNSNAMRMNVNVNMNHNNNNNENINVMNMNKNKNKKRKYEESDFLYVVKMVDYSKKYGIGYILSNGFTGIYFNDSTKILLNKNKISVTYFDEEDNIKYCSFTNYPKILQKKMTLLKHFDSYLWSNNKSNHNNNSNRYESKTNSGSVSPTNDHNKIDAELLKKCKYISRDGNDDKIFLNKFTKTKHAVLLKLSNKTVQVNFTDSTKIIINSNTSYVMYHDKNKNNRIYSVNQLNDAVTKHKDLQKRCKYTQELLKKITSNANSQKTTG